VRYQEDLRHPHGKTFDDYVGVEWLEDILREQAMINARVLVLSELRQLVLSYVHHDVRFSWNQQLLASRCGVLAAKMIWAALVVAMWVVCQAQNLMT
jgi:hypothetical protein